MQDYFFQEGSGVKNAVLQHMPENYGSLLRQSNSSGEGRDMMPVPNLDAYVFVRVLADCGQVALDPKECASRYLPLHTPAGRLAFARWHLLPAHCMQAPGCSCSVQHSRCG